MFVNSKLGYFYLKISMSFLLELHIHYPQLPQMSFHKLLINKNNYKNGGLWDMSNNVYLY